MNFLKLTFLVLMFLQVANAAMAQVARVDDHGNVIIKFNSGQESTAGKTQVIPKGTLLYHWGKATPEQAKAWNDEGKISPDLLARLRLGSGFAGGGFYVSTNYLDSMWYGNTLVVVELQKDIHVISGPEGFRWSNPVMGAVEKIGYSAAVVAHNTTWMNIFDSEALTKTFVADADFFVNHLPKNIDEASKFKDLFKRIPGLSEDPTFQQLAQESDKLIEDLHSKNPEIASNAFQRIIENGSSAVKKLALEKLSAFPEALVFSEKNIDILVQMANKSANPIDNFGLRALIIAARTKRSTSYYLFSKNTRHRAFLHNAAQFIREQLPPDQASTLFQEAADKFRNDPPIGMGEQIAIMKKAGTWNPQIMCSKVFQ